jgi:hypothetical protein
MSLAFVSTLFNLGATHPIRRDILPFDMDAKNPANDNVRIANQMRASGLLAVIFICDTDNAMHAALERHGRICDARRAHKPRGCLLDVEFFEFVIPGLLAGVVDVVAEVIAGEPSQFIVSLGREWEDKYVAMFQTNSLVSMQFMTVSLERFL